MPWERPKAGGSGGGGADGGGGGRRSKGPRPPPLRRRDSRGPPRARGGRPAFSDSRATLLLAAPLLLLTLLASLCLQAASALAFVLGGWDGLAFACVCLAVAVNGATYHRREIYLWLGAGSKAGVAAAAGDEDEDDLEQAPPSTSKTSLMNAAGLRSHELAAEAPADDEDELAHANDVVDTCWSRAVSLVANVALRLPDAPTRQSRAIARGSPIRAGRVNK